MKAESEKLRYGFTPLLWDGKNWREAYGYLGSYYSNYRKARYEIDFIMREFPNKYSEWCIERVQIDKDQFCIGETVVVAQSRNAPV